MSLKSSVSLGTLTLTEGNPVVTVPEDRIADAKSDTITSTISADELHNTGWSLSCVDSTDSNCSSFITESPQVYLRILKATKSGQDIYGLGVWASSSAFSTCGSVDMKASEAAGIVSDENSEGGDFTWVQNTTGPYTNATSTSSSCPLREGTTAGSDNLEYYYALDKLKVQGSAYTLIQEDEFNDGGGCTGTYRTAVTFNPSSATEMYGNFAISEDFEEASPGDCGSDTDYASSFIVKFTKQ
jgi:hypothetical protein